jgi:hypothetical protein
VCRGSQNARQGQVTEEKRDRRKNRQVGKGRQTKGARTKRDGEQDKRMSGRTCMKRKRN